MLLSDVDTHREDVAGITTLAVNDLTSYGVTVLGEAPEKAAGQLRAATGAVVETYGETAAVTGALFYETQRPKPGYTAQLVTPSIGDAVMAEIGWALAPLFTPELFEPEEALNRLSGVTQKYVSNADRETVFQAAKKDPTSRGVRWYASPNACAFCALMSAQEARTTDPHWHNNCFPAGVTVSGPHVEGATRRPYDGELVVLTTASGQNLTVTGNHPILTRRGWVPANLIREGDEVVRSTRPDGAAALCVPDHDQVPARIEDVWRALRVAGSVRVLSTAKDFHGDGQYGEVDIVRADRAFGLRGLAAGHEHFAQDRLAIALGRLSKFARECASKQIDLRDAMHATGLLGLSDAGGALIGGAVHGGHFGGFAHRATLHTGRMENARDRISGNAVLTREREFGSASAVRLDDLVDGQLMLSTRWDAAVDARTMEGASRNASVGVDLLGRLAGQVELDRVVHAVSRDFHGHVYSLNSSEGWHVANSLIVSNCHCVEIPGWDDSPIPDAEYMDEYGRAASGARKHLMDAHYNHPDYGKYHSDRKFLKAHPELSINNKNLTRVMRELYGFNH